MASTQLLDILKDIETATLRNAAQLPLKKANRPEWQGLGFQLGGVRLVSALGEVVEILKPPRATVLPRVKPWVLGISNIRGRLIPIIDLHRFLGIEVTVPRSLRRVLVVETEDFVVGLQVEQSLGMQHFLKESFEAGEPEGLESIQQYISGAYRHGGRVYYILNLKSLAGDKRFLDVEE